MNPVDLSRQLVESIDHLLENRQLKGQTLARIEQTQSQAQAIFTTLRDINENTLSLEAATDDRSLLRRNIDYWRNDFHISNRNTLDQLREHSVTLHTLYRKGINVIRIYKFSEEESRLTQKIGQVFFSDHRIIEGLKQSYRMDRNWGYLLTPGVHLWKTLALLRTMAQAGLIEEQHTFSVKWKMEESRKINFNVVKKIAKDSPQKFIQVNFTFLDKSKHRDLIQGHWFNCYAYQIIYEHLFRNNFDFEIYTRVDYRSPIDIFSARGDFDILAMVDNKILLVECKSGKIDQRHHKQVGEIIQTAQGLKEVFSVTEQEYEYLSVLVYNEHLADEEFLKTAFQDTEFNLVRIGDLRSSITKVFSGAFQSFAATENPSKPIPAAHPVPSTPIENPKENRSFFARLFRS